MWRVAFLASAAAVAALAVVATGALAANPTVIHFSDSGSFTDPNFCGTGESVNVAFDFRGTDWLTPNHVSFQGTVNGPDTFTNPANGSTVVAHITGLATQQLVSSSPSGDTVLDSHKGLPEQLKTTNGTVLTRDAGYIQFLDTFDSDGNQISSQIVIDRGPHPDAESGGAVFCDVATSALGL